MGLDMYLRGDRYHLFNWENEDANKKIDEFIVKSEILDLGYWRKHPNLHGYIVQEFADGIDDCQQIELDRENILKIIDTIKNKELPFTEGFFFGISDGSEDEESIQIFEQAIKWLDTKEEGIWKSIYYRACW